MNEQAHEALFNAAREVHKELSRMWLAGGFPVGIYDAWRELGKALGDASPLADLQGGGSPETQAD